MSSGTDQKYWMYIALLLGIVILGNSYVMFYTVFRPATDNKELLDEIRNLETQIQSLNIRINNRVLINQSGNDLSTKIYDLTRGSVVLIQNRVQTLQGLTPQSLGSGFIYSVNNQDQYVVTNYHVIEGASDILITFESGNSTKASIVGTDQYSDLAVLKLSTSMPWLKALALANSSDLKVGERVLAIGSPFGLSGTMTSGIVSQVQRDLDAPGNYKIVDVIQLDENNSITLRFEGSTERDLIVSLPKDEIYTTYSMGRYAKSTPDISSLAIATSVASLVIENKKSFSEPKEIYRSMAGLGK